MNEKSGSGRGMQSGNTRKLALSGILSALIIIALVLESIAPTGRLGFYVLAAFFLSVVIIENGIGWAWASYAVACAAGFLVVPEKLNIIPFVIFFGIYTMLKFHIESIRKVWAEILLKIAAFNLSVWPAWSIAKSFLSPALTTGYGAIAGGILLNIGFVFYDYLFTAWVRYYQDKIGPRIRRS